MVSTWFCWLDGCFLSRHTASAVCLETFGSDWSCSVRSRSDQMLSVYWFSSGTLQQTCSAVWAAASTRAWRWNVWNARNWRLLLVPIGRTGKPARPQNHDLHTVTYSPRWAESGFHRFTKVMQWLINHRCCCCWGNDLRVISAFVLKGYSAICKCDVELIQNCSDRLDSELVGHRLLVQIKTNFFFLLKKKKKANHTSWRAVLILLSATGSDIVWWFSNCGTCTTGGTSTPSSGTQGNLLSFLNTASHIIDNT